MKRLLRIFTLLTAASMLVWMVGCGGDEEEEEAGPAPKVASVVPASGAISSNTTITVTFSKKVASATIMINGTPVAATTTDNKVYTFQPNQEGALTLTIDAEDDAGQGLDPAFAGASYTASAPDTTPPTILGDQCSPKKGDTNVEPADVTEIVIVFSEAMKDDLTVDLTEPADVLVDTSLSSDKTKVTIKFLGGYSPGQETRFDIDVTGSDLAGNAIADGSYSFTTKAKEE